MKTFKLPDFNGGFISKSIENGKVVTRDNEGMITDIQPILYEGIETNLGQVVSASDQLCVVRTEQGDKCLKKSLAIVSYPTVEEEDERLITGTFETIIGEVKAIDQPEVVRKGLCNPSKIEHSKNAHTFILRDKGEECKILVKKSLFGFHVEEVTKSFYQETEPERKPKEVLLKAFGVKVKAPKLFGKNPDKLKSPSNKVEGAERPNHKYIERRINPNPKNPQDKYIYLYELPTGKKSWKNQEGEEIEGMDERLQNESALNFKTNDVVVYKGQIARITDASDNFIFLQQENKKIQMIDKRKLSAQLKEQENYKVGQSIETDQVKGVIRHVADNLILVKKEDNTFQIINKVEPISLYQASGEEKKGSNKNKLNLPKVNSQQISSQQTALQGYNRDVEFLMNNYDYETQPEYQVFGLTSLESGFGKKNDLQFEKYVKVGDETRQVVRTYNPAWKEVDVQVDGVTDYKIRHKGETYIIKDILEGEGDRGTQYIVQDKEGNLFQLDYEEYKQHFNKETEKASEVITDRWGTTVVDKDKKQYKFSGNLDKEQQARVDALKPKPERSNRFAERKRAKTLSELQAEERQAKETELQRQEAQDRLKTTLQSPEYIFGVDQVEHAGYSKTENPFIFKKKMNVESFPFELTATYNRETGEFEKQISGKFETVEIAGEKRKILDITKHDDQTFITYEDPNSLFNDNKGAISLDTLKELNGKNVFERTGQGKGLISKKPPQLTYFDNTEKELTTWEVIELKDLVLSHNTDGTANSKYSIKEMQNRDRTSADSKQQVAEISSNIKENFPLFLPTASIFDGTGASVVTGDYEVVSGNGRGLAIASHYEANGKEYKAQLIEHSEAIGFDPQEVAKMNEPVVVRKLIGVTDKQRLTQLGVLGNTDKALAQTDAEVGKAKSKLISKESFSRIGDIFNTARDSVKGEGTISDYLDKIGAELVNEFVKNGVIQQNEVPAYYNQTNNKIDSTQKEKIKSILTNRLFGEAGNHLDFVSSTTQSGITDALPFLMKHKDTQADITEPLGNALKLFAKFEAFKTKGGADTKDFLLQAEKDVIEPLTADPKTLAIFQTLANQNRKDIRGKIAQYDFAIEGDVFTPPAETPEHAFQQVFKTDFPTGIGQQSQQPKANNNISQPSQSGSKPAYPPKLKGEADKAFLKRIKEQLPSPQTIEDLPEEHGKYFNLEGARIVSLDDLVSSKSDEENEKGGNNAPKFMKVAYDGYVAKRDPIEVEPIGNGKYRILDGNGTYTGVKRVGWKQLPVKVVERGEIKKSVASNMRQIIRNARATRFSLLGGESKKFGENDTRIFDKNRHRWTKPEGNWITKDGSQIGLNDFVDYRGMTLRVKELNLDISSNKSKPILVIELESDSSGERYLFTQEELQKYCNKITAPVEKSLFGRLTKAIKRFTNIGQQDQLNLFSGATNEKGETLQPSKKNPQVRRWQKTEKPEESENFEELRGEAIRRTAKINLNESDLVDKQINNDSAKDFLTRLGVPTVEFQEGLYNGENLATGNLYKIKLPNRPTINTVLHEAGHFIQATIHKNRGYDSINSAQDIQEVLTTYGAHNGSEAFAENTRLFFIAPETLRKLAPKVYDELNNLIAKETKELVAEFFKKEKIEPHKGVMQNDIIQAREKNIGDIIPKGKHVYALKGAPDHLLTIEAVKIFKENYPEEFARLTEKISKDGTNDMDSGVWLEEGSREFLADKIKQAGGSVEFDMSGKKVSPAHFQEEETKKEKEIIGYRDSQSRHSKAGTFYFIGFSKRGASPEDYAELPVKKRIKAKNILEVSEEELNLLRDRMKLEGFEDNPSIYFAEKWFPNMSREFFVNIARESLSPAEFNMQMEDYGDHYLVNIGKDIAVANQAKELGYDVIKYGDTQIQVLPAIDESRELEEKAKELAIQKHNNQKYNDDSYFDGHILPVVERTKSLADEYGLSAKEKSLAIQLAYMHDLVEDTNISQEMIADEFGEDMLKEVLLLSDKIKTTGEKKNKDDYYRELSKSKIAKIVKTADRIENVSKLDSVKDPKRREKLLNKYLRDVQYYIKYDINPEKIKNAFQAEL